MFTFSWTWKLDGSALFGKIQKVRLRMYLLAEIFWLINMTKWCDLLVYSCVCVIKQHSPTLFCLYNRLAIDLDMFLYNINLVKNNSYQESKRIISIINVNYRCFWCAVYSIITCRRSFSIALKSYTVYCWVVHQYNKNYTSNKYVMLKINSKCKMHVHAYIFQ